MWKKLFSARIWHRLYIERAGEPILYNIVSIFVALFGSIVSKIDYDLVPRQPYAFGMLSAYQFATRHAEKLNIQRLVFIEFGVAAGAGLMNMCDVGSKLQSQFGIPFAVFGFDTGHGMPEPVDYRDHPELYLDGDFPPGDTDSLTANLPDNARVIYGPIRDTVQGFHDLLQPGDVVAFVSIDVDYWSSTCDCYRLFDNANVATLPMLPIYLDDTGYPQHHPFAGELLATHEFNLAHEHKKITPMNRIRDWRIFKRAPWLGSMYWMVNLHHAYFRRDTHRTRAPVALDNPYLVGFRPRME